MNLELNKNRLESEWRNFVDANSRAMFQIALLLAANPQRAEDALIAGIDGLDCSRQPRSDDLLTWERYVVKRSVGAPSPDEGAALDWRLVQPGLRPILLIDPLQRTCFVLRLLLGYTAEECACILGVEMSAVPLLVAEATTQLGQIVAVVSS